MGTGHSKSSQPASDDDESISAIAERIENEVSKFLIDETKLHYGCLISQSEHTTVHDGTYMDKPVAIKVIQNEPNVSPSRKNKFEREIALLSAVESEDIVKFIGFTREPAMTTVTEMMKGGTLQMHLWNIRPYTIERKDALVIALGISRAMAYLHQNGIIHRDLKPSCIFLSESKKSAKLGDIGLCRLGLEGDFSADVGSIRWMAPEVFSREQQEITSITTRYNHKVDVYSFAIVLWELLINKTPFQGKDNNYIAQAVIKNERPSLDGEDIPEDILYLLKSCWSNDPQLRPEFWLVSELLEEILTGIEPGWDKIEPAATSSRADETTNLLCEAKKISTSLLCSCCYLSIHAKPSCSCPSCHSIGTSLCSCFPSCLS